MGFWEVKEFLLNLGKVLYRLFICCHLFVIVILIILIFSCMCVFVFEFWNQQKLEKVIQSPKPGVTDGDKMSNIGVRH